MGDHLCSPPAVLLWRWLFTVLVYWGLVSLPHPLSLGQGQWFISCPPAVSVLWWFTVCFSIWKGRLTLGVAHWLRRWALLIRYLPVSGSGLSPACFQPSCLSSLCLLIVHEEISSLPLPPSLVRFSILPLLLCASFQFLVYSVFFLYFCMGASICPSGYAGLSTGWLGE
jgi:hypothetical protein